MTVHWPKALLSEVPKLIFRFSLISVCLSKFKETWFKKSKTFCRVDSLIIDKWKIKLAVKMLDVQIPDVHEINVLYKQRTTDDTPIILVTLWIFLISWIPVFVGKGKLYFSWIFDFVVFTKFYIKAWDDLHLADVHLYQWDPWEKIISRIIIESKVIKLNCKLKMCIKVLDHFLMVQFVFQWYYLPTVMTSTNYNFNWLIECLRKKLKILKIYW